MNKYLKICIELNDLMYELKIVLPRNHSLQHCIDEMMVKYRKELENLALNLPLLPNR